MQSRPSTISSYSNCYLQIRRAKQTIFTDVTETTTVIELKQIIGNILQVDPNQIRLLRNSQILDIDSKLIADYGINRKNALPQNPYQLEFVLKSDSISYENVEVVPYSTECYSFNDNHLLVRSDDLCY